MERQDKPGRMGYEEWRVGNVTENEISRVLGVAGDVVAAEQATVAIQVKEMGSPTSEVQRTSSSWAGTVTSLRRSQGYLPTSS